MVWIKTFLNCRYEFQSVGIREVLVLLPHNVYSLANPRSEPRLMLIDERVRTSKRIARLLALEEFAKKFQKDEIFRNEVIDFALKYGYEPRLKIIPDE